MHGFLYPILQCVLTISLMCFNSGAEESHFGWYGEVRKRKWTPFFWTGNYYLPYTHFSPLVSDKNDLKLWWPWPRFPPFMVWPASRLCTRRPLKACFRLTATACSWTKIGHWMSEAALVLRVTDIHKTEILPSPSLMGHVNLVCLLRCLPSSTTEPYLIFTLLGLTSWLQWESLLVRRSGKIGFFPLASDLSAQRASYKEQTKNLRGEDRESSNMFSFPRAGVLMVTVQKHAWSYSHVLFTHPL
jgi:hypothetical protein